MCGFCCGFKRKKPSITKNKKLIDINKLQINKSIILIFILCTLPGGT